MAPTAVKSCQPASLHAVAVLLQSSEIIFLPNIDAGAPESVSGLEYCDCVLLANERGVAKVQALQWGAFGIAQSGARSSSLAHTHLLDKIMISYDNAQSVLYSVSYM